MQPKCFESKQFFQWIWRGTSVVLIIVSFCLENTERSLTWNPLGGSLEKKFPFLNKTLTGRFFLLFFCMVLLGEYSNLNKKGMYGLSQRSPLWVVLYKIKEQNLSSWMLFSSQMKKTRLCSAVFANSFETASYPEKRAYAEAPSEDQMSDS